MADDQMTSHILPDTFVGSVLLCVPIFGPYASGWRFVFGILPMISHKGAWWVPCHYKEKTKEEKKMNETLLPHLLNRE